MLEWMIPRMKRLKTAMSHRLFRTLFALALLTTPWLNLGCGFDRIQPTPPETIEGLTFEDLSAIQDDETLTTVEKQEAIRAAIDAPLTPEGDRLVDFLLNFPTP
jgi:hypothetical protein